MIFCEIPLLNCPTSLKLRTRGATDFGPRGGKATERWLLPAPTNAPVCRSDSNHMRRRGAKSFVDDLVLSRGVVLSRADLFCDLLRLSPMTRRFVRFRRTYLRRTSHGRSVPQSVRSVERPSWMRGSTYFSFHYRNPHAGLPAVLYFDLLRDSSDLLRDSSAGLPEYKPLSADSTAGVIGYVLLCSEGGKRVSGRVWSKVHCTTFALAQVPKYNFCTESISKRQLTMGKYHY